MAERGSQPGANVTPIASSIITRVVSGVLTSVKNVMPATWFGPSQPIQPLAPEVKGRNWDYPVGYNIRYTPRGGEAVSFTQMRALADAFDILRLVIETRKDQMEKMEWTVRPIDPKAKNDSRINELIDFLRFPDGEHPWHTWLRAMLEDMFVIDALTIYPRLTRGGELYSLELYDGATIKRIIDADGRTPVPPSPAYQQVLHGVPAVDYSRDELIYRPRNFRTNRVYGYSAVEQIIVTVNIAIRRQLHQLQYYTEGSLPDLIFQVPATWNPDQVKEFNDWFQGKLAGDTAERRKAQFVPAGVEPFDIKQSAMKDEYDEWLARVCCYAFSVSPLPFVKMMNRGSAETQKEAALEEGLYPVMNWVKSVMDYIIWKYFGFNDLEFVFDEEEEIEPLVQAQMNDIYIRNGTLAVDEVRADLGKDAIGAPNAVYTAAGPVPLGEEARALAATQQEEDRAANAAAGLNPDGSIPEAVDPNAEEKVDDEPPNNPSGDKPVQRTVAKRRLLRRLSRGRTVRAQRP
jgi:hypothetical protein